MRALCVGLMLFCVAGCSGGNGLQIGAEAVVYHELLPIAPVFREAIMVQSTDRDADYPILCGAGVGDRAVYLGDAPVPVKMDAKIRKILAPFARVKLMAGEHKGKIGIISEKSLRPVPSR